MKKRRKLLKLLISTFCLSSVLILGTKSVSAADSLHPRQMTTQEKVNTLHDIWRNPIHTHQRYKIAPAKFPRRGISFESHWFSERGKIAWNDPNNTLPNQPMTGLDLSLHKQPWNPNYDDMISVQGGAIPYEAILHGGDKITIKAPRKDINQYFGYKAYNGNGWTSFSGDANAANYQKFEINIANRVSGGGPDKRLISLKNMVNNKFLYVDNDGFINSDGLDTEHSNSQWVFVPVDYFGNLLDKDGKILKTN
ncbi:hypothetical protein [Clostridium oceanicum]|uniref:Uncharacterized protein n=1 Tax=Clostridium oceanicum TaxID=1543 RepID=A0ABN1JDD9_9CLOT